MQQIRAAPPNWMERRGYDDPRTSSPGWNACTHHDNDRTTNAARPAGNAASAIGYGTSKDYYNIGAKPPRARPPNPADRPMQTPPHPGTPPAMAAMLFAEFGATPHGPALIKYDPKENDASVAAAPAAAPWYFTETMPAREVVAASGRRTGRRVGARQDRESILKTPRLWSAPNDNGPLKPARLQAWSEHDHGRHPNHEEAGLIASR